MLRSFIQMVINERLNSTEIDERTLEALTAYVNDSRTITSDQRIIASDFVKNQVIVPSRKLERIESDDPEWFVGDVINLNLKSFTMASVTNNEKTGHIGWKSKDQAITCIQNATKGWIVDYSLIKTQFSAIDEREVIVTGRYRVIEKKMITEPFTNPNDGYKVPLYVLVEV